MPRPAGRMPHYSLIAKLGVLLAACGMIYACASMLFRVTTGQTDFSIFYRTAQAVQGGVAAEFYGQMDEVTDCHRCISPAGTMLFAYMPWLSLRGAALVWVAFNLGLLVLCAWCLWRLFGRLERQRRLYQRTWPWALVILAVLALDCLQVGQLSLLFTTCWLVALVADKGLLAASMLMLPAAIKLYPALLFALPLGLRRWREALWLPVAAVLVGLLLPWPLYGRHLLEMWAGFSHYMIFSSESSRVVSMINPYLPSNQSLDVTVLRYLADLPDFGRVYPWFPHLALSPAWAMRITLALKLGLLLVTGAAAWRLGSRAAVQPRWTALVMLGLWSVTLHLLLPETKARYAVYAFPAWLPVLALLTARHRHRRLPLRYGVLVGLGLVSQVQLMPPEVRIFGPSLVATAALWAVLLRVAWQAPATAGTDQPAGR